MRSKTILVLLPFAFYRPSGSSFNSYFRVRALLEIGNNVEVITYPHGEDLTLPCLKIKRSPEKNIFKEHQAGEYKKKIIYDIFIFFTLFKRLLTNKYDMVIAHSSCIYFAIFFKIFFKSKFIANVHGNLEVELIKWRISKNKNLTALVGRIESYLVGKYDAVICIHKSVKNVLLKNNIKNRKIYVIHNSIISDNAIIDNTRTDKPFTILYAGTFVEVQNLSLIYKASEILNNSQIKFLIVGGTEPEIKQEQDRLLSYRTSQVEFIQRKTQEELMPFFVEADIVVSPRVYGHDTPMKLFDYLSKGKCILATNRPIHTEVLNNTNSYLFEPTPEKLAEAILFLKNNPDVRRKLGEKAKADFEANYSFDMMKKKYKTLFDEIFE